MERLLIVRHGESEWNAARRLQGHADIVLSENGRRQAIALRPTVARWKPDLVATSDLMRTRETASLLGYGHAEQLSALREHNVGDWTGQSIDAIRRIGNGEYERWRAGEFTPPGGESWQEFRIRTHHAVLSLAKRTTSTLLVVAHGGVVRALLESFLALTPAKVIPVGTASLTILRCQDRDVNNIRLEVFNYSVSGPELNAPD